MMVVIIMMMVMVLPFLRLRLLLQTPSGISIVNQLLQSCQTSLDACDNPRSSILTLSRLFPSFHHDPNDDLSQE